MENKIFQALSNLRHNGVDYAKGDFFEGLLAEFAHLVKDGALRIMHRATSIEHAKEMVSDQTAAAAETVKPATVEPKNTWGPKEDTVTKPADAGTTTVVDATVTTTPPPNASAPAAPNAPAPGADSSDKL